MLANDIHGEPRLDALRSEFGAYGTVELADWNDIKDCVSVVGLRGLMNNVLGWSEPRGGPKVTCNGQQYWIDPEDNAKRGYYVSFYHGGVPSWYLAHDKIEDGFDYLALGSWHNELPVLAKVQLKMFSSAQSGVAEDVPLIPWSQVTTRPKTTHAPSQSTFSTHPVSTSSQYTLYTHSANIHSHNAPSHAPSSPSPTPSCTLTPSMARSDKEPTEPSSAPCGCPNTPRLWAVKRWQ